uniref:Uncharacterized protein n=1 Tax=Plectus sambesii TaxID=2011161 RepID=A0A914X703_9BILA
MKSKAKETPQKADNSENAENSGNTWHLERIGGSALSLLRPVFDSRNEKVMCASGGDVLIIEAQTGALVGKLEHSETVVALHFSSVNEQLVTCTNRGDLYIWDVGTRTVVKYHKLPAVEVFAMVTLKHTYVLGVGSERQHKGTKVFKCEWPDSATEQPQWTMVIETNTTDNALPTDERMIAFSDTLIAWCCKKQIHARLLNEDGEASKSGKRVPLSYTCAEKYERVVDNDLLKFESVAVHGPTDSVAAGFSTGKIFLWYNVSNVGLARPSQFIHWQKSPVMDLVFTHEGTSLVSGGGETVLVKYTLHSAGQPTRQFLARVGGGILRVSMSSDNARCALVLDDNSVQIVHTIVMNVVASAQGLIKSRLPPSMGLKMDWAGAAGPRTLGSILTNGRPGQIQFFDPVQAMHIFSVKALKHFVEAFCRSNVAPSS